ncbi:TonB-dependent receptor [Telluria mixta]|uniref:TonB-dependent receptor n=1 Tax=Telluria mixta TaxID=34071 RepID=A0ABT2BYD8_9BURK|nr:TonB-dependent receptor [Telluria mixta]MCS0630066.1 TonB-dependent receptor [Telluria mixta]WEM94621.1 TonB-dependent receptor [Telluria mixta]
MMFYRKKTVVLAIGLCFGVAANAQDTPENAATPAMTVGIVTVTGKATGPLATRNVLTSVDMLDESKIATQAVSHNWQLFGQLPGVMLTQYGQGTTSGKISIRGFTGEGEINAVKLLIDGIPSNSNDGMMPYLDLAPLLDIRTVELVRGTNDPRYGLHNIAGNANIVTKIGGNYGAARLGYGSFDTRDAQAALGIDRNGFSQNYAASWQQTDGYRAHSDADKASFSGKWFYSPDNGTSRYGLIVRHHETRADEPGFLTAAQARADWEQSMPHNATDRGTRRMDQVALQAETAFGSRLFWTAQVYHNALDDHRYVTFSAEVRQQERTIAENHTGASTTLTWRPTSQLRVVGGLDTERQDNASQRWFTANEVRQSQTRDQQFDLNTAGGFVQAIYKPVANLTITPALRVDRLTGSYTNLLSGRVYGINDYGLIRQPKLSAVYQVNDAYAVYGNFGRTFQIGIGTATYKVNQTSDLAPSINDGWETGVKFRPAHGVEGRIAVWQQYASNEARRKMNDPANDAENIGETRRRGVDLQLNVQPTSQLGFWLGAAVQRARIVKADAGSIATQGHEIDHTPHLLYNVGADYHVSDALRLSASINGQGSYFLDRTNTTGKFGAYSLVNVSAAYSLGKNLDVELQVRNLADRYYEYVWHDGTQSLHAPGSPRNISLMLTSRF